jgi:hypothetical protein
LCIDSILHHYPLISISEETPYCHIVTLYGIRLPYLTVKQKKVRCFLALLLLLTVRSAAQEHNAVPLDHPAYEIIAMGAAQGIIISPPVAKPWSTHMVREKLWEMLHVSPEILSSREEETIFRALDSLERKPGLELIDGRYHTTGTNFSFETGIGWESGFSVYAPGGSISSVNRAKVYAGGDAGEAVSWNVTALGEFLYPDDPALGWGVEAELNGSFFDRRLLLRLGRIRHDWGYRSNGDALFLNACARPFTALEGTVLPLPWLNIYFLGGVLEHYRGDSWSSAETAANKGPFTNMFSAGQVALNLSQYFYLCAGAAAVLAEQPNAAFFADVQLRMPGLFTLWGSVFFDHLNESLENFNTTNGNNFAYQAGIMIVVHWLPFSAFTLRYTKIEPYCYTAEQASAAFINGGESLGYYLPPNSDELLLRFESRMRPGVKAHVQFQMIRHGADFGDRFVPGSSLYDVLGDDRSSKFFLMDGVYQWDNIIKLGASGNLKSVGVPVLIYAETGLVITSFTINGKAGIGNEADYEPLEDSVYRPGTKFIFSIGFRVFP